MRKSLKIVIVLILVSVSFSCSKFRKIERSDDISAKFEAAMNYYENKDYYRSTLLLEQLLPLLRGDKRAERGQYIYAYAHYHQKLYIQSAYYFKLFYETYSRSEFAEEAMYMHAYSLYNDSPAFNLDQTSTMEAIQSMQAFLDKFPQSKYREEGNAIINAMQEKLENKAYASAKEYYKLRTYDPRNLKAAIIAFENFEKDFPDSKKVEEISFLKINASYQLAQQSVITKKKERYEDTMKLYQSFIDYYPESVYLKKAESIYKSILQELGKTASSSS